jgi:hypothetical protein
MRSPSSANSWDTCEGNLHCSQLTASVITATLPRDHKAFFHYMYGKAGTLLPWPCLLITNLQASTPALVFFVWYRVNWDLNLDIQPLARGPQSELSHLASETTMMPTAVQISRFPTGLPAQKDQAFYSSAAWRNCHERLAQENLFAVITAVASWSFRSSEMCAIVR